MRVHVPKLGEKKKLLEFSQRNAKFYMIEKINQMKIIDLRITKINFGANEDGLRLKNHPEHIECFDN